MVYVCADLHGCEPARFRRLLAQAGFREEDHLFILGDVIDRGEWGAELLLWITQQPNVQLILGNHEAQLIACGFLFEEVSEQTLDGLSMERIGLLQNWIDNGGGPTLKGLRRLLRKDPESLWGILDYLRESPLYEQVEVEGQRFVLVHGGLGNFRPDRPLEDYTPEELLMDRPAADARYFPDARVIFGHTPTLMYGQEHRGKAMHTPGWSCIDVGVSLGYGPMVLRLDDGAEFYLEI